MNVLHTNLKLVFIVKKTWLCDADATHIILM